jgi:hypothetical protein
MSKSEQGAAVFGHEETRRNSHEFLFCAPFSWLPCQAGVPFAYSFSAA